MGGSVRQLGTDGLSPAGGVPAQPARGRTPSDLHFVRATSPNVAFGSWGRKPPCRTSC